ncbi:hypothetical protein J1614_008263 [Plenodomus biglobosus]|nr:hypothetical protein J1614_008263 [Plenodomus biglobosus]
MPRTGLQRPENQTQTGTSGNKKYGLQYHIFYDSVQLSRPKSPPSYPTLCKCTTRNTYATINPQTKTTPHPQKPICDSCATTRDIE